MLSASGFAGFLACGAVATLVSWQCQCFCLVFASTVLRLFDESWAWWNKASLWNTYPNKASSTGDFFVESNDTRSKSDKPLKPLFSLFAFERLVLPHHAPPFGKVSAHRLLQRGGFDAWVSDEACPSRMLLPAAVYNLGKSHLQEERNSSRLTINRQNKQSKSRKLSQTELLWAENN